MKLCLVHLYPDLMSIYGDLGNVICLQKRAQWRGIELEVINYNFGDRWPADIDLIFMGGGQDTGQSLVADDLYSRQSKIVHAINDNVPALVICGGYQLFGHYFLTNKVEKIKGLGVFDITTHASQKRMIGNIVIQSKKFGKLVGFENHSGQTKLAAGQSMLGTVISGFGNNSHDKSEGAVYKNAIGTYLHGSFLPKNPQVADYLLISALRRRYDAKLELAPLDDHLAVTARKIAQHRPR